MKKLKDKINASNKIAKLHSVTRDENFEYKVSYSIDSVLFSFYWVCDFYKEGNIQAYYMFSAECENESFQDKLWACIDLRESDENPLLSLYLELRDDFVNIFNFFENKE